MHQCGKGYNCSCVLFQVNAGMAAGHTFVQTGPAGGLAASRSGFSRSAGVLHFRDYSPALKIVRVSGMAAHLAGENACVTWRCDFRSIWWPEAPAPSANMPAEH